MEPTAPLSARRRGSCRDVRRPMLFRNRRNEEMKTEHGRACVVLIAALTVLGAWKTSGLGQTTGQAATQVEVRAAWNEYIRAFSAGRADIIADRVYMAPSFNLAATGIVVSMTPADIRARLETSIETLAAQNYQRTETKVANICCTQRHRSGVECAVHSVPEGWKRPRRTGRNVCVREDPARMAHRCSDGPLSGSRSQVR